MDGCASFTNNLCIIVSFGSVFGSILLTLFGVILGGVFAASQRTSGPGALTAGLHPVSTGVVVKSVRHLNGRDESARLRPIRRSGLAGKKSLRAEVSACTIHT